MRRFARHLLDVSASIIFSKDGICLANHISDPDRLPRMPAWVTSVRAETLEDVAFMSGAALRHLHVLLNRNDVSQSLLRERLALLAAETSVAFLGRSERAADLRDAVYLLRPRDLPRPAGEIRALCRALPTHPAEKFSGRLDAGQGAPVARAAMVLEAVLQAKPRAETATFVLADAALPQALGWDYLLSFMAVGLKRTEVAVEQTNRNDVDSVAVAAP